MAVEGWANDWKREIKTNTEAISVCKGWKMFKMTELDTARKCWVQTHPLWVYISQDISHLSCASRSPPFSLPLRKDIKFRWTGNSSLAVRVNVSVSGCLLVCVLDGDRLEAFMCAPTGPVAGFPAQDTGYKSWMDGWFTDSCVSQMQWWVSFWC